MGWSLTDGFPFASAMPMLSRMSRIQRRRFPADMWWLVVVFGLVPLLAIPLNSILMQLCNWVLRCFAPGGPL